MTQEDEHIGTVNMSGRTPTLRTGLEGPQPIATVAEMGVGGMRLLLPHPPGSVDHLPIGTKLYAAPVATPGVKP
jgi:hypothetical protein